MKQLLILLMFLCSASVFAQDVIVKKDGSTIVCRVVELNSTEIIYKMWSNLNGSSYVMDRTLASSINYENGKKINLSEVTNLYKPNNQSDGIQQYNDKALLKIDALSNNPYKRVKTLRQIGWIGGAVFAGAGLSLIIFQPEIGDFMSHGNASTYGFGLIGLGAVWTTIFQLSANHQKKKTQRLLSTTIYQYDFKYSNGNSLTPRIDLLRDQAFNQHTLGLGLCYNF